MKFINLKTKVTLALITALVIGTGAPVYAEGTGLTLEDSIRNQIFLELKDNVEHLYRNSREDVTRIEPTVTVHVVKRNIEAGFSPPLRIRKDSSVRTINHELFN
jgi:hypothetical protein